MFELVVAIIWLCASLVFLFMLVTSPTGRLHKFWVFFLTGLAGLETIGKLNKHFWLADAYAVIVALVLSLKLACYLYRHGRRP